MRIFARDINFGPQGGFKGPGPLGQNPAANAPSQFQELISRIVGVMTIVGGIWFLFLILTGGIAIISSGGDKGALEGARKRISSGVLGLFILVAGVFLVDLVGSFIGIDILDVAGFISQIAP